MGGSERVVLNLCRHLDRSRFFPVISAFRGGPLEKEMMNVGMPVHVLERCGGVDLRLIWKLIHLIRRYRIQIVNSHHFVALFYSFWATRWTGVPMLHTEHSRWEMENLPSFWNSWFRFFLRRVELISAVSQATFDHLRQSYGVQSKRVVLILNAIDVNCFTGVKADAATRALLEVTEDMAVVATVGNLRQEKNQKLLIVALHSETCGPESLPPFSTESLFPGCIRFPWRPSRKGTDECRYTGPCPESMWWCGPQAHLEADSPDPPLPDSDR